MERVTREGWAVIRGNNEFYVLDDNTPRAPSEWLESNAEGWHPVLTDFPAPTGGTTLCWRIT